VSGASIKVGAKTGQKQCPRTQGGEETKRISQGGKGNVGRGGGRRGPSLRIGGRLGGLGQNGPMEGHLHPGMSAPRGK